MKCLSILCAAAFLVAASFFLARRYGRVESAASELQGRDAVAAQAPPSEGSVAPLAPGA